MISSRDNEKLKLVRKLHERRWRDKLGLFVVRGRGPRRRRRPAEPVELLVAGENVERALLARGLDAPRTRRAWSPSTGATICRRPSRGRRARALARRRPGNVGTLIRTADAFGAAVALSAGCADPTGPKALRASAGSIWRVAAPAVRRSADRAPRARSRSSRTAASRSARSTSRGGRRSCSAPSARGCRPRSSATLEAWIPIDGAESLNVGRRGCDRALTSQTAAPAESPVDGLRSAATAARQLHRRLRHAGRRASTCRSHQHHGKVALHRSRRGRADRDRRLYTAAPSDAAAALQRQGSGPLVRVVPRRRDRLARSDFRDGGEVAGDGRARRRR